MLVVFYIVISFVDIVKVAAPPSPSLPGGGNFYDFFGAQIGKAAAFLGEFHHEHDYSAGNRVFVLLQLERYANARDSLPLHVLLQYRVGTVDVCGSG